MSSPRYERVAAQDAEEGRGVISDGAPSSATPASPPPSFHSRTPSPARDRRLAAHDPLISDAERALAASFDSGSDNDDDADEPADGGARRRPTDVAGASFGSVLYPGSGNAAPEADGGGSRRDMPRRGTVFPGHVPSTTTAAGRGIPRTTNDGVFANLSAKPVPGEKNEEQPPSYEQAAADATPPYWETTIFAPGVGSDEVFIDGLPVGSVFSFVWNGLIAMTFHFVGFLLTYLLHTTHAAKNGSLAGLGVLLVQWGFALRSPAGPSPGNGSGDGMVMDPGVMPSDPNSHDVGAAAAAAGDGPAVGRPGLGGLLMTDWIAYGLMIVGWFILIRAVSSFLRARRHEQLVLQSPDRGLGVPVVAEGEAVETAV
ncbi:MAG: hypothetical protein M1826_001710 [Phylliscum demangeonii]|nr:MAG: hypothetical protein M1826_001710 [Phylliscum demangeonii]